MFCPKCGKEVLDGTNFCSACGADLKSEDSTYSGYQPIDNSQKNTVVNENDQSNLGYTFLSFFILVCGITLYCVWKDEYPKRARSCLNGIIAGVIIWIVLVCCAFSGFNSIDKYYETNDLFDIPVDTFLECLK